MCNGRKADLHYHADLQRNITLAQAEKSLIYHMRSYIRRDMHAGAVLSLYYGSLSAYYLDGIKEAVPYADTRQGKGSQQRTFHGLKKIAAYHKAYQSGNDRCHGHYLPVALEDEHTEKLSEIDTCLGNMSFMLNIYLFILLHSAPPAFLLTS